MPGPVRQPPTDPPDLELIEQLQALQGEEMPADQDAVIEPSESKDVAKPTTTGSIAARARPPRP